VRTATRGRLETGGASATASIDLSPHKPIARAGGGALRLRASEGATQNTPETVCRPMRSRRVEFCRDEDCAVSGMPVGESVVVEQRTLLFRPE
jgi:hypothetical protein